MTFENPGAYRMAYVASIVVTALLFLLGAISTVAVSQGTDVLGITPTVSAWLLVASTFLGALQGILPRITTPQSRTELKAQVRAQAFDEGAAQVAQVVKPSLVVTGLTGATTTPETPPPPPPIDPNTMKSADWPL